MSIRARLWGQGSTANENYLALADLVRNNKLGSLFQKVSVELPTNLKNIDL